MAGNLLGNRIRSTVIFMVMNYLISTALSSEKWSWGPPSSSDLPNTFPDSRLPHPPPTILEEPINEAERGSSTESKFRGGLCSLGGGFECLPEKNENVPSHLPGFSHETPVKLVQHHHIHTHRNQADNIDLRQQFDLPSSQAGHSFLPPVMPAGLPLFPSLGQTQLAAAGMPNQIPLGQLQPQHFEMLGLPQIPFGGQSPVFSPQSLYQEDCLCVHTTLCRPLDVVSRSMLDLQPPLIDPRSRFTGVLSNATESEAVRSHRIVEDKTPSGKAATENINSHAKRAAKEKSDDLTKGRDHLLGGYAPGDRGCRGEHVCCRDPTLETLEKGFTCGRSHTRGLLGRSSFPNLTKGDAEFGEHPWQAAILQEDVYVCGAALVTDRHVLTAAHCVTSLQASSLKVRLGEWDVSKKVEFLEHLEIPAAEVRSHPQYYAGNLNNDIALITLQYPVDFIENPHISPVCLPDVLYNYVGQRCYSTGWGKNAFGEQGRYQHILKEIEVPVVSHQQCQASLRHTRLGQGFSLHEGMMCAGGEETKDACTGDGGGPLVCYGPDGRAQLAGLVSWGIGCGNAGVPGVYVNVAYYMDWILAYLRI